MPILGFKKRFADAVENGFKYPDMKPPGTEEIPIKRQTIRLNDYGRWPWILGTAYQVVRMEGGIMQKTGIEYLTHTWNPTAMRCTKCSPGCDNCWHLRRADRLCKNKALPENERNALAGSGPFVLREREILAPLRVRKPAVIGVQFMGDLFHEAVPDEFIGETFRVMASIQRHTFLILTKRPQRMLDIVRRLEAGSLCSYMDGDESGAEWVNRTFSEVFPNVWPGLTICNQEELDRLWTIFAQVPGKKFLSIEPMLGPIDLSAFFGTAYEVQIAYSYNAGIDAVILGGESGPGARPCHPDWIRSIRDQCAAAGVPFFFKQWGEWAIGESKDFRRYPEDISTGQYMVRVGRKAAGRLLDGRTHDELPWRKP